jgi:hypothetical protein
MIMQMASFACDMPIYCALHLLLAPMNSSLLNNKIRKYPNILSHLLYLGYLLPTVLTMLPLRWSHPNLHMRITALWQSFPVIILALQYTLPYFHFSKVTASGSTSAKEIDSKPLLKQKAKDSLSIVTRTSNLVIATCTFTHWMTVLIITAATLNPTLLSWAFSPKTLSGFRFSKVFQPPNPFESNPRMQSLGHAFHGFLQWDLYLGFTASIFWVSVLLMRARAWKSRTAKVGTMDLVTRLLLLAVKGMVVGGPGVVLTDCLRTRDRLVLKNRDE